MPTNFDVPGFPDGTVTIPVPASCPELANIYNAPACAFDHELTYIPMQMDLYLADTGSEVMWLLILAGWVLVSVGVALVIGRYIRVAEKLRRAGKTR